MFKSKRTQGDKPSQQKMDAAIKRLERFSKITDSNIGVPFTKFKFGIDAIIGLIPVAGDVVGVALSSYVLLEAHKVGAGKRTKLKMLINILIDFFGGLIPLFGDFFDAYFKANTRNTAILKEELIKQGKAV
ncbi:DUF4112 domain-containing protein [Psychromonas aquatilis]|uniref:DUF4112 domain-containing protein n=1 Tax=Psychromonas aquatilis TaxID=2005072 RepID=A0ABU9GLW3_9GAMM